MTNIWEIILKILAIRTTARSTTILENNSQIIVDLAEILMAKTFSKKLSKVGDLAMIMTGRKNLEKLFKSMANWASQKVAPPIETELKVAMLVAGHLLVAHAFPWPHVCRPRAATRFPCCGESATCRWRRPVVAAARRHSSVPVARYCSPTGSRPAGAAPPSWAHLLPPLQGGGGLTPSRPKRERS